MNTREKVIVVIAVLALVIGGGYHFLGNRTAQLTDSGPAPEVAQAQAVKAEIEAQIDNLGLTPNQSGILAYIAAPWVSDPFFIPSVRDGAAEEELPPDSDLFVYGGFIEVGSLRIAIINGTERFLGDELEVPGYRVQSITPSTVVIVRPDGDSTLNISYQGLDELP